MQVANNRRNCAGGEDVFGNVVLKFSANLKFLTKSLLLKSKRKVFTLNLKKKCGKTIAVQGLKKNIV